jgi:hypothetical protein
MAPKNSPKKLTDFPIFVGSLLIAMIVAGLWLLSPMIIYDLGRMQWWQKILFWLGDFTAIAFVLRWMFRAREQQEQQEQQEVVRQIGNVANPPTATSLSARTVASMLILSLLLDMAVTGTTLYSNSLGKQRAVVTVADVDSVSESSFRDALHYRVNIYFLDPDKNKIKTYLKFGRVPSDPILPWQVAPLEMIASEEEVKTVDVMYDPNLPRRVWFKDQDDETSIAIVCCLIHLFQLIGVLSLSSDLFSKRETISDPKTIYLLPVAIYAAGLLFMGFAIHHP